MKYLSIKLSLIFLACAHLPAADQSLPLNGNDWRIRADAAGTGEQQRWFEAAPTGGDWIPATVPGNIQADVEAAHLLPPLWYGALNPDLYEVARKDWWYRKDFTVPASYAGKRLTLVFNGVDERCQVWLNGKKIGANAGMFRRFSFDVTELAKPGQPNHLAVQLGRMPEEVLPYLVNSDGPDIPQQKYWFLNGINFSRTIIKDLKTPGNFGWDWSTNLWTLGIWKNVTLEATGPARIESTRVESTLADNFTSATVKAILEIDSTVDNLAVQADFRISGHGSPLNKQFAATLKKGHNLVKTEIPVEKPALWWPNGQGAQPLYTLDATVKPAAGGECMDAITTRFGIREVRWIHTEGAPANFVSKYQLVINGRPVRTIGSGIILPHILQGCGLPHAMQLMHQAKAAGMNFIRINGGGGAPLFDDPWYSLADESGIMISYEYPIGNCWPENDPVMFANVEATCRGLIRDSRNHPSIIEYVGGNEMSWNSTTVHPLLQALQKMAAEESDRIFRATCPDAGAKHSPWMFDMRSTYRHYKSIETMRYGEFGTCSPANLETWYRDIPIASQWPINLDDPILIHKNAAQAVFNKNMWSNKADIDWAFAPNNLPDFIRAGQYIGAEGLRYAYDALRRKGKRIGGMTNHCYSEPWPNAAGSGLVDFDGRTLMNYDFLKQALAPISLSLAFDTVLYEAPEGIKAELFLTSDAPAAAPDLRWQWLARDRTGKVIDQGSGTGSINPIEVKSLAKLNIKPDPNVGGAVLVELRLLNAAGQTLTERVQIFVPAGSQAWAGFLDNKSPEQTVSPVEAPDSKTNLAFSGNGAKPATATSSRPEPKHQASSINDGCYGNEHSWIAGAPGGSFQIDLGKPATVARFKIGRDRTGELDDRLMDSIKIETSTDGKAWQTVFERADLGKLADIRSPKSMVIETVPVTAQQVRVTVKPDTEPAACIDEFEVYGPASNPPKPLPSVSFERAAASPLKPVGRTALVLTAAPVRTNGDWETLALDVRNTGKMTALFCEPHPTLVYRTDLAIDNKNCCIPPGETRMITIRAPRNAVDGLTLAQTGWSLSCWNADDVTVEPGEDVLLSIGRHDKLCREFAGYSGAKPNTAAALTGARPDAALLPYLLDATGSARFEFNGTARPARLRLHTADQSAEASTEVEININGRTMVRTLPKGLGIQRTDPAHLAFPATVECDLPASDIHKGKNSLIVKVKGAGWFTWDALELINQ